MPRGVMLSVGVRHDGGGGGGGGGSKEDQKLSKGSTLEDISMAKHEWTFLHAGTNKKPAAWQSKMKHGEVR